MACNRCGATNPGNARFCLACGAALDDASGPSARPKTSGKAIASLVCGIFFMIFPAAVAAVITGHLALSEIRKSAGRLAGRGLATAGLALGYIGVAGLPVFFLIGAAIIIPNLLRARMAANESSAVGALRVIEVAATRYAVTYGNGFPPDLETLAGNGGPATCDHADLIPAYLVAGPMHGYVFSYAVQTPDHRPPSLSARALANGCAKAGGSRFVLSADPVTRNTTGQRSFFVDQTGVIRYNANDTATADDPKLE